MAGWVGLVFHARPRSQFGRKGQVAAARVIICAAAHKSCPETPDSRRVRGSSVPLEEGKVVRKGVL